MGHDGCARLNGGAPAASRYRAGWQAAV